MHTLGSHRVYIYGIHNINHLSQGVCRAAHPLRQMIYIMYSIDVNTMGSQSVHSIL